MLKEFVDSEFKIGEAIWWIIRYCNVKVGSSRISLSNSKICKVSKVVDRMPSFKGQEVALWAWILHPEGCALPTAQWFQDTTTCQKYIHFSCDFTRFSMKLSEYPFPVKGWASRPKLVKLLTSYFPEFLQFSFWRPLLVSPTVCHWGLTAQFDTTWSVHIWSCIWLLWSILMTCVESVFKCF